MPSEQHKRDLHQSDLLEILDDLEDVDIAGLNPASLLVVVKGLMLMFDLLLNKKTLDDLLDEANAFREEERARKAFSPSSPCSPGSPLFWSCETSVTNGFDAANEAQSSKTNNP